MLQPDSQSCIRMLRLRAHCVAGTSPLPLVKLVDNFDASYDYVANDADVFTLKTNLNAPRYRCARRAGSLLAARAPPHSHCARSLSAATAGRCQ